MTPYRLMIPCLLLTCAWLLPVQAQSENSESFDPRQEIPAQKLAASEHCPAVSMTSQICRNKVEGLSIKRRKSVVKIKHPEERG